MAEYSHRRLSHEYFSAKKFLDLDSHRRAPSLKLGPIPISTDYTQTDADKKIQIIISVIPAKVEILVGSRMKDLL